MKRIKISCLVCLLLFSMVSFMKPVEASIKSTTALTKTNCAAKYHKTKRYKKVDESINVRRFNISDAPSKIQKWVDKCQSKPEDIYVLEYKNRYWIYTNLVRTGQDFEFHAACRNRNKFSYIAIIPHKDKKGAGYALLSSPKDKNLTIYCGKHSVEVEKK